MDKKETHSITEVSQMLGISDATLRKYEKDYSLKIPRNELGHRFYTAKEIEVFQQIVNLKEQGANIHVIKKILSRSDSVQEQKEQALELVTLDKLTGAEFKELMMSQMAKIMINREKELTRHFEEKLDGIKDKLSEEIRKELKNQQEQRKLENERLLGYIAATREEENKKSFWDKIFGK